MKKTKIGIYVTAALLRKIDRQAKKNGATRAGQVHQVIQDHFLSVYLNKR